MTLLMGTPDISYNQRMAKREKEGQGSRRGERKREEKLETDRMHTCLYIHLVKGNCLEYLDLVAFDVEAEVIDRLDSQGGDVKCQWEALHVNVLPGVCHVGRVRRHNSRRVLRHVQTPQVSRHEKGRL